MSDDRQDSKEELAMAIVATSSARLPNASQIIAAAAEKTSRNGGFLRSLFGRRPRTSDQCSWKSGILMFPREDAQVLVTLLPVAIPWSSLAGPCATSWWWPEATACMEQHACHFFVVLRGGSLDSVERRIILTRLTAAIVRESDAVGVYWGEGTLVHEPGEFLRQAESASPHHIPGTLWIDVRVEEYEDGSLRCFTTGLAPLGFLEIEVRKSYLASDELMSFVGDTACYIVNNRLHIADGETMGHTATEQYQVRDGPSMFDRSKVMQIVMA